MKLINLFPPARSQEEAEERQRELSNATPVLAVLRKELDKRISVLDEKIENIESLTLLPPDVLLGILATRGELKNFRSLLEE